MVRRKRSDAAEAQPTPKIRQAPKQSVERPRANTVTVPHDTINEIVMLAAVIVDVEAAKKYLPSIPADSFYGQGHAAAWAIMQRLQGQGLHYDPATVQQMSGGSVDTDVLESYAQERPKVPPNIRYHAACIAWDRARVEAVRGPVTQFLEAIKDPACDPNKVRALARAIGNSFEGVGDRKYLRDPAAIIREHRKELENRRHGHATFSYGLEGLDFYGEMDPKPYTPRLIPGCAPGKVTVVTGISGGGKSTTTARIALEQARQGRRVLYGAWEQDSNMTLEIIAAMSLEWSRSDLMCGNFKEDDQEQLLAEMDRLGEWIRFMSLPFGREMGEKCTNQSNLDLIHQYISDVSPDVFIADLFKRVMVETRPDDEESALWRMQAITQETRCHSILLQQLKLKDVETRQDQRPTRDSVKGNSAWIDIADTVLAWYRPSLHKNVPDDVIQALILKQRYGAWPLAVEFDWNPEFGFVGNGRSIEYDRPGQEGGEMDGILGESFFRGGKASSKRKRAAS
jgi:replicative DNA helicase